MAPLMIASHHCRLSLDIFDIFILFWAFDVHDRHQTHESYSIISNINNKFIEQQQLLTHSKNKNEIR